VFIHIIPAVVTVHVSPTLLTPLLE